MWQAALEEAERRAAAERAAAEAALEGGAEVSSSPSTRDTSWA